jgi:hypothetical protein
MYDIKLRDICINVYNQLIKYNIKGIERKKFIYNAFDLHINSLYNWIKKDNYGNKINKYKNHKIDCVIENYIVNIFNNETNIKNIKKLIKNNFNVILSYKDILCVMKSNNLKTPKKIIKDSIDNFIIDGIKSNVFLSANEIIKLIRNLIN